MRLLLMVVMLAAPAFAEPRASCEAVRKTARFTVHFDHVELGKLAQTVSDATCRAFIVGENVKGAISMVGPENGQLLLDADQFYAAFLAALDANGFAMVRDGPFGRIIDKPHARQQPVPLFSEGATLPARGEVVTRIFKVKSADLEPTRALLTQLLTPGGDLMAAQPDVLIATDVVANLQRFETLLTLIDVPRAAEMLRLMTLRHADAADVADKVQRLFPKNAARPEPLTVVVDERTNRILAVASPAVLERVAALVSELDVEVPGDGRARVYRLKNADAKEMATTLEGMTQTGRAKGGPPPPAGGTVQGEVRITANESLNALVIVANAGDYRTMVEVIEQLDVPQRQVFIETAIMEVNLERDSQFGVSFHGVAGSTDTPVVFGSQPEGAPSSLSLKSLASASGLLVGVQGPVLTQVGKLLGFDLSQFGVVLQALQLSSDVNVLSTPHILTTDNKEAEIVVGQRVPFQSGANPAALASLLSSGNATAASTLSAYGSNVTRERVELKLTVKPHIGDGDQVRLDINQQAEEIAGSNSLGPITSTRGQRTTVVARDDETLVLGGIMQDRVIDSVAKTPVLGDLPLVGQLFRNTSKKKTKVNLLVFLTPHIIRDASDFRRLVEKKSRERQLLLEQFYGGVPEVERTIDYQNRAGPLASMGRAISREERKPENGGHGEPGDTIIGPRE